LIYLPVDLANMKWRVPMSNYGG